MLKEKFIREIYADQALRQPHQRDLALAGYAVRRAYAEVHPETGIALLVECLPPDPSSPNPRLRHPPKEFPKDCLFMGIPLRANDSVPRGELVLRW